MKALALLALPARREEAQLSASMGRKAKHKIPGCELIKLAHCCSTA